MNRRTLIKSGILTTLFGGLSKYAVADMSPVIDKAIVLSTWYNQAVAANEAAWQVLSKNGSALDAVTQGVMISENDWQNCCVGLGGNPDRDGKVTLDACIMDHQHRCGGVAALEQIQNPILVARAVMEKTPHLLLAGAGAQQFALANGFKLKGAQLSDHAQKAYDKWLLKSEYKPVINIEQTSKAAPTLIKNGEYNHDTIGMIAMDHEGNLSGACTTSGMAFKMHGRVGDSPIIGAGLYVDNEVGAATATGNGEEVMRTSGSFLVVEFMRQGMSPMLACKKAVERVLQTTLLKPHEMQVGFLALNKQGTYGGYAVNANFDYAVKSKAFNYIKVAAPFSYNGR